MPRPGSHRTRRCLLAWPGDEATRTRAGPAEDDQSDGLAAAGGWAGRLSALDLLICVAATAAPPPPACDVVVRAGPGPAGSDKRAMPSRPWASGWPLGGP
jgi:hypothetical protein